ncbi:MAG TPA: hypothetical protein DCY03_06155, partial [Planctomycetaceae bacterium]|nr:hypothetical protein [Planctomycetaceae bacterium]
MNKSKEPFGINPSGEGDSWESLAGDLFGIDFDQQVEPLPIDFEDDLAEDEETSEQAEKSEPAETEQVKSPAAAKSEVAEDDDDQFFGASIFDDDDQVPASQSANKVPVEQLDSGIDFDDDEEDDEDFEEEDDDD